MRVLFGLLVIVGMAIVGVFVWKARRAKGNWPALDAVASWMDTGAERGDVSVKGVLRGRPTEYENKQYRTAGWTEIQIRATGSLAFVYKSAAIGDPLQFDGAASADAERVIRELGAAIQRAHPRTIAVGDGTIRLVADRMIMTGDDARGFVQLALDLAAKVDGGPTAELPPPPPGTNRVEQAGEEEKNMALRVGIFVPTVLLLGAGIFWSVRKYARAHRA